MNSQLKLQSKLVELLESEYVYYQPPENLRMEYPAIVYFKRRPKTQYADDIKYSNRDSYEVVIIDKRPDNPVINKILELPFSSYDRHYISNNLHHDVIILYI